MAITKEMVEAWKPLIPTLDKLPAAPERCILHWTAGPARANSIDKAHYHYIFNQPTGEVVRGDHTVAQNMGKIRSTDYAQHTGGFNSGSVGFSFAGMLDSAPGHKFGPVPLTEDQVRNGLAFVSLCMLTWNMRVTSATLFTHHEAWTIHKVKGQMNDQKWDITELAFARHLAKDKVGPWMREVVRNSMVEVNRLRG